MKKSVWYGIKSCLEGVDSTSGILEGVYLGRWYKYGEKNTTLSGVPPVYDKNCPEEADPISNKYT